MIGRHDFSAFRAAECQAKSPVRTLDRLDIAREGNMIRFDLHADAFLYRMVRNIVGALVYVGNGRQPPSWIGELLARARSHPRRADIRAPPALTSPASIIRSASICRRHARRCAFLLS